MTNKKIGLLPCPWCKTIPSIDGQPSRRGVSGGYRIYHNKLICPVEIKTRWYGTQERLIKTWNSWADQKGVE